MGLLKKLGLVEEEVTPDAMPVETTPVVEDPAIEEAKESDLVSVNAIYKTVSLGDLGKSIYKVEELKNALPSSLDNQAAKQSVLGVMKVAGLGRDAVIMDSDKRITALTEAKNKLSADVQEIIQQNLDEIAKLEAKVNDLKQMNNQKRKLQEEQEAAIDKEIARIEEIVKFIS